jgi:hypothetical protein
VVDRDEHDLRIPPHLMKWALLTYLQAPLLQQPLDCSRYEQGEMDPWVLHAMCYDLLIVCVVEHQS